MARPKLTLYLDCVSPFAYMAFYLTRHSPVFKNCDITYIPIFLGGLMKACNNTPPIEIKNKSSYLPVSLRRYSTLFSIPLHPSQPMPTNFPPLTLQLQRTLCGLQIRQPARLGAAFEALYRAFFVEHRSIEKAEVYAAILKEVLGGEEEEVKKVMEGAAAEGKERLKRNTDKALGEGAFGLPWFVATNSEGKKECFFGFDHIGMVVDHLGLIREGQERGWRAML
ncbi:HCCA isomerase/glutathione S-transferase kappa [Viridothelium virens]|uniref:Glutathione S-transferase kappa n=1 Tax=Viridothelium virens TaxID=1048519 RepID=A0A6A6HML2_VIRVR|nr:HCCA isomerase/glutathione S-transferase kappa [Viridothelium virens]